MATQKFPMFLYHVQSKWDKEGRYKIFSTETLGDNDFTLVGPVTVEAEVPDAFDPRPGKIAALKTERARLRAKLGARLTDIERQISELTAIDHAPVEDSIPGHSVPF